MSLAILQNDTPAQSMSGTSGVFPFDTVITAGQTLLVIALLYTGRTNNQNWTITDNQGNKWKQVGDYYPGASNGQIHHAAWLCIAKSTDSPGVPNAVDLTWLDSALVGDVELATFSGISNSITLDGTVQTATGTGTISTPPLTPFFTGGLVINICSSDASISAFGGTWNVGDIKSASTGSGRAWLQGGTSAINPNATNDNNGWTSITFAILAIGAVSITAGNTLTRSSTASAIGSHHVTAANTLTRSSAAVTGASSHGSATAANSTTRSSAAVGNGGLSATAGNTIAFDRAATPGGGTWIAAASNTLSMSSTAALGNVALHVTAASSMTRSASAAGSGHGGNVTAGNTLTRSSTAALAGVALHATAGNTVARNSTALSGGAHSTSVASALTMSSSASSTETPASTTASVGFFF